MTVMKTAMNNPLPIAKQLLTRSLLARAERWHQLKESGAAAKEIANQEGVTDKMVSGTLSRYRQYLKRDQSIVYLSGRLYSTLTSEGITDLRQLEGYTEFDLLSLPNTGPHTLEEARQLCYLYGINAFKLRY